MVYALTTRLPFTGIEHSNDIKSLEALIGKFLNHLVGEQNAVEVVHFVQKHASEISLGVKGHFVSVTVEVLDIYLLGTFD